MPNRSREMSKGTNAIEACAPLYALNKENVKMLVQSDGFKILRDHLEQTYSYDLCTKHQKPQPNNKSHWFLVRDMLYALLVPIVELCDRAAILAGITTDDIRPEGNEGVFSGVALTTNSWLQYFLSDDTNREWCYAKGCPACVTEGSLDSEDSVHILYTACLLSDVQYPYALDGPKLPSFKFFLSSLQRALTADPRYRPGFFNIIETKAIATRDGIENLICQCVEVEGTLTTLPLLADTASGEPLVISQYACSPICDSSGTSESREDSDVVIERGRTARRQTSIQMEHEQYMEETMKQCTLSSHSPRSAASIAASSLSMSNLAKEGPTVTVTELQSAG